MNDYTEEIYEQPKTKSNYFLKSLAKVMVKFWTSDKMCRFLIIIAALKYILQ